MDGQLQPPCTADMLMDRKCATWDRQSAATQAYEWSIGRSGVFVLRVNLVHTEASPTPFQADWVPNEGQMQSQPAKLQCAR